MSIHSIVMYSQLKEMDQLVEKFKGEWFSEEQRQNYYFSRFEWVGNAKRGFGYGTILKYNKQGKELELSCVIVEQEKGKLVMRPFESIEKKRGWEVEKIQKDQLILYDKYLHVRLELKKESSREIVEYEFLDDIWIEEIKSEEREIIEKIDRIGYEFNRGKDEQVQEGTGIIFYIEHSKEGGEIYSISTNSMFTYEVFGFMGKEYVLMCGELGYCNLYEIAKHSKDELNLIDTKSQESVNFYRKVE